MSRRISRRSFLKGAAAAGAASVGPWVIVRPGWTQTGPIKIGITEPLSGPVTYVGEGYTSGAKFAANKLNQKGGVLGREVEIVAADSELKPDVATRRANDLLFGEKVDILAMGTGSSVGKAVSQVANQNRKIFISTAPRRRRSPARNSSTPP